MRFRWWLLPLVGTVGLFAAVRWRVRSSDLPGPLSGPNSVRFNPREPFYRSPELMPEQPGTLIRSQVAPHLVNPFAYLAARLGLPSPQWPARADRIVFSTQGNIGEKITASGVVIEPIRPWNGPGPTPTVILAPGTRGQGGVSASSLGPGFLGAVDPEHWAFGINYELINLYLCAWQGMRVVQVDYPGTATDGVARYVDPVSEAHTVLDAARATAQLRRLDKDAPFGLYGYSQGGGAAAAAAEAAGLYAPELNIVGTYAGAPASDMLALIRTLDGTRLAGFLTYSINGMRAADPVQFSLIWSLLSEEGRRVVNANRHAGALDTSWRHAGANTSSWTKSGRSLAQELESHPQIMRRLKDLTLGKHAPNAPVLIISDRYDDIVPYSQSKELATAYKELGAQVEFRTSEFPGIKPGSGRTHLAGLYRHHRAALQWLLERFHM